MTDHTTFSERFASVTETVRLLTREESGVTDDARGQLATLLAQLEVASRFGDRALILRRAEAFLAWTWSVGLAPRDSSVPGSATARLRITPPLGGGR